MGDVAVGHQLQPAVFLRAVLGEIAVVIGIRERTLRLEQRGGEHQVTHWGIFRADFHLMAAVRVEDLPGVVCAAWGRVALLHAVSPGGVERDVVDRLIHQAGRTAGAAVFFVAGLLAGLVVVADRKQVFATRKQQAPLRAEVQGVAQQEGMLRGGRRLIAFIKVRIRRTRVDRVLIQ